MRTAEGRVPDHLQAEEEMLRSYDLHANSYITKPVHLDGFLKLMQSIGDFRFDAVKLPPR